MSFENPQGLWLLALGVPVVVFHFYKGRIRRLEVPSLLFWEQVIVEEERRTALKKLRHVASLLLNLAALVLLTSAMSVPHVRGLSREKARYAVVVDNTSGMAAPGPDGRTRHAAALDLARDFVLSRGHGDQVSVHDLSGARLPFTSDLEDLARRLGPSAPARRPDPAGRIRAALGAGDDVTAVLFSDRVPAGVDDLLGSGRLRVARVGAPLENSGWVSGTTLRRAGEKRIAVSLALASFAARPVERSEVIRFNRKELARRPAPLAPGATAAKEWVLDPSAYPGSGVEEGGLVEVALEPPDDFPADDTARFVVPPLVPPKAIVFHAAAKPDPHLMHALHTLRAGGFVGEVNAAPGSRLPGLRLGEGWVVILDRLPAPPGEGAFLVFGAPGGTVVERPTIADWDRASPVNRMVDYAGLAVRRSRILDGPALIRAVEGPIATWTARGGRAVVEFGFALGLEESDLQLRHAFLTMLFNVVDWAAQGAARSFPASFAAGDPVLAERPLWFDEGELLFEQGDHAERLAVRAARAESAPRASPGFLRLSAQGRAEWAAANLFDAGESDLRETPVPPAPLPPPPEPWHARVPYSFLAAALVLALLLVEAWLFYRGVI